MTQTRNKRSLTIARHRTSVSLEEPFWTALADIAKAEGKSIAALVSEIDKGRSEAGGGRGRAPRGAGLPGRRPAALLARPP